MKKHSTETHTTKDLMAEARLEVAAAQHNLKGAISTWTALLTRLHPDSLLLEAAERRLEKANALLRSALEITNHD